MRRGGVEGKRAELAAMFGQGIGVDPDTARRIAQVVERISYEVFWWAFFRGVLVGAAAMAFTAWLAIR